MNIYTLPVCIKLSFISLLWMLFHVQIPGFKMKKETRLVDHTNYLIIDKILMEFIY